MSMLVFRGVARSDSVQRCHERNWSKSLGRELKSVNRGVLNH